MTSRADLLKDMQRLAASGIDCAACRGTCCTFIANSMRIGPDEAKVIADHLEKTSEGTLEWKCRLADNVRRFALDRPPPGDGRREFARRRYTCPFFLEPGCALPFSVKPLGCLAFNPRSPGQTDGGDCGTNGVTTSDLDKGLAPIPVAVLAALS